MNRDEQKTSFISAVMLTVSMPHHKHVDTAYIERERERERGGERAFTVPY